MGGAPMTAQDLAQRCQKAYQTKTGSWQACCPAHDDVSPSLSITDGNKGTLVKCHADCPPDAIVAALGLTMADLFSTPASRPIPRVPPSTPRPRVVAEYDYTDAHGAVLYQVQRWEPGRKGGKKDFSQRRPDGQGGWINNMDGVTRVLWRLPEVLAAVAAGEVLYVVEGEKACLAMVGLGLCATTKSGGAKAPWESQYSEALRGAHVVILPDHDSPGQACAQEVAQALHGIAAGVKVIDLPGVPDKGDVVEWLAAGGDRAQLEALVQAAPLWQSPTPPAGNTPPARSRCWDQAISAPDFLAQDDVELQATVRDMVVPGCITVVSAPRASGKSLSALYLAVSMASGGVFRGEAVTPQRVLLCDRDNPPALVRKRLKAFGAHTATGLQVLTRDHTPPLTDRDAWADFPVERFDVVIIDSLGAATEGVSEKEGRETQQFLATLKDLARRGPAVLALDNTQKSGLSYRGRGEKADAVDILYECRNVTGWTPADGGDWWESLPDAGEHAWQARASRRKGQAVLRLAFIPSKFRLGIEPEPFVLEIDTQTDPWSLHDVTTDIAHAGERAAADARKQERQKLQQAIDQLTQVIRARGDDNPLLKAEGAMLLQGYGVTRKQARTLLESGGNADIYPQGVWTLRPIPAHPSGKAIGIYLAGGDNNGKRSDGQSFPSNNGTSCVPPFADGSTPSGQRSGTILPAEILAQNTLDLWPRPGQQTAKGDEAIDKHLCGSTNIPRPFAAPSDSSDDLPPGWKAGFTGTCPQHGTHLAFWCRQLTWEEIGSSPADAEREVAAEGGAFLTPLHPRRSNTALWMCSQCYAAGSPLPEPPVRPPTEAPAVFETLTATLLWCGTCQQAQPFRTLHTLDGGEVSGCQTCDTEVGRKTGTRSDAPQPGDPIEPEEFEV